MKRVALLIETSRGYGRDILSGVREYLSEGNAHWRTTLELRDLQSPVPGWLHSWSGDGLLVRTDSTAMVRTVARLGVPAVELRSHDRQPGLPFVGMDNEAIGRMAARYFMDLGLAHFGVYALRVEDFFVVRRQSFLTELGRHGHKVQTFYQTGSREKPKQWSDQQQRLVQWLSSCPKPIGVLACTDQLGCWLLEACREAGVKVPDEVAVLGVENDETLCNFSDPPLSSIRLSGREVGRLAAERLDAMMRSKSVRKRGTPRLVAPSGITVRQSSDWIGIDDPLITTALQRIRSDGGVHLNVEQLASDVGCSRSTLERRFRERLERSPNEEIVRQRIAVVCQMLDQTTLSLSQIAKSCGLGSASYLSQRFVATMGQTPGCYRRRSRSQP